VNIAGLFSLLLSGMLLQSSPPQPSVTAARPPEAAPPTPLPSVLLPPDLDRVLRDYEKAWQAHDAAALAELFAEDGFVMPGSRPPVRGRSAIRATYGKAGGPLSLRALAFSTSGDIGYIIGGFGREPGNPDTGKFILALKRAADGRWLIEADIDNSNRGWPMEPALAPGPQPTAPPRLSPSPAKPGA
jgi:ketosteroid isomerase-like protein